MPNLAMTTFERGLPSATLEGLRQVLLETAASIEGKCQVLTEADLGQSTQPAESFVVVTSEGFSALLQRTQSKSGTDCPVQLTFDPQAIAAFLQQLRSRHRRRSRHRQAIERAIACQTPSENNATLQSHFTVRLLDGLVPTLSPSDATPTAAACQPMVDAAMHQQLIQERLLNQVVNQIRQSLELQVILETVVEQVRAVLHTDRLVIYQFTEDDPGADGTTDTEAAPTEAAPQTSNSDRGCVTYESLASDHIPSVLAYQEQYCWSPVHECRVKYSQGFILAVDDVERNYTASECLLDFLRTTKVRAKLVAPILVQSQLWGLLIAHQCDASRHWQDHEKALLQHIGEHMAIAIYQAQLYQELQQQKQTLEEQVALRTQELHQALVATQSVNQAKSDFLATMSHELRTPLTCVIGMSATLLRWSLGPLSDKQRRYLQTIHDNGEHLLDLINDILDLSHVESGKANLQLSEFSLSTLVQQILQMLREKAQSQKVNLKSDLHISPHQDRFVADPRRVEQILFNLLDNAIKFTPAGGKVTLRAWVEAKTAVFQVEDTGIGIPASQQSQLFQKFQQLDTSYRRNYEGAGLGLALVKQLVDLHRGWIEVSSVEGQGSIFTVELPNQSLVRDANLIDISAKPAESTRGRIVLIESHEEIANLICDMLTAGGYQVVWTIEGSTAVEQIRLLQPVAVIMDLQYPGGDSNQLIQELRQLPRGRDTKLVILTTKTMLKKQLPHLATGVDAYLTKPIDPERLVYKIDNLLTPYPPVAATEDQLP